MPYLLRNLDQERQVGEVAYILMKRMVERNSFWKSSKPFKFNNRHKPASE